MDNPPIMGEQVQIFRLLDLPPELWLRICQIAITLPNPIILSTSQPSALYQEKLRQPPLTSVNRALRRELLPHFYGTTTFIFEDKHCQYDGLNAWLHAIGPENYRHLAHVAIYGKDMLWLEVWVQESLLALQACREHKGFPLVVLRKEGPFKIDRVYFPGPFGQSRGMRLWLGMPIGEE